MDKMLGDFVSWLIFGPDGQEEEDGFVEAETSGGGRRRSTTLGYFHEDHSAGHSHAGRRVTLDSTRRLQDMMDKSGGGLVDLQCGRRVFNDVPAKVGFVHLYCQLIHMYGDTKVMCTDVDSACRLPSAITIGKECIHYYADAYRIMDVSVA